LEAAAAADTDTRCVCDLTAATTADLKAVPLQQSLLLLVLVADNGCMVLMLLLMAVCGLLSTAAAAALQKRPAQAGSTCRHTAAGRRWGVIREAAAG
jgi:hypothetical protein